MLMRKQNHIIPSLTVILGVILSSLLLSQAASAQTTIAQENAVITSDDLVARWLPLPPNKRC